MTKVVPVKVSPRKMGITDVVVRRAAQVALGGFYSWPKELAVLWRTEGSLYKSVVGVNPIFSDTPTLSAGGVIPGDGPSFTDVVSWSDGGTLVVQFTATTASSDLVGDVQVFGPVYAHSGGLKAKDGTNTSTGVTSWAANELVTAIVSVFDDGVRTMMRVVRAEVV